MILLVLPVVKTYLNEKQTSVKFQKEINLFNRIKYAEDKQFCNFTGVNTIYERNNFNEIYEDLAKLKNKDLKTKDTNLKKTKK